MRYSILTGLMFTSIFFVVSSESFGVDPKPIERKIDNSDIMARVQLIGVIAGGATKTSGIAVIKDSVTGRTYAIKTGDSLPGVAHIKLTSVRRGEVVFNSSGKQYLVRLVNSSVVSGANDHANTSGDSGKDIGTGLFDQWNDYRSSTSNESTHQAYVSPTVISSPEKDLPRGPMILGSDYVPQIKSENPANHVQEYNGSNYLIKPSTDKLHERESSPQQTANDWTLRNGTNENSDAAVDQTNDDEE